MHSASFLNLNAAPGEQQQQQRRPAFGGGSPAVHPSPSAGVFAARTSVGAFSAGTPNGQTEHASSSSSSTTFFGAADSGGGFGSGPFAAASAAAADPARAAQNAGHPHGRSWTRGVGESGSGAAGHAAPSAGTAVRGRPWQQQRQRQFGNRSRDFRTKPAQEQQQQDQQDGALPIEPLPVESSESAPAANSLKAAPSQSDSFSQNGVQNPASAFAATAPGFTNSFAQNPFGLTIAAAANDSHRLPHAAQERISSPFSVPGTVSSQKPSLSWSAAGGGSTTAPASAPEPASGSGSEFGSNTNIGFSMGPKATSTPTSFASAFTSHTNTNGSSLATHAFIGDAPAEASSILDDTEFSVTAPQSRQDRANRFSSVVAAPSGSGLGAGSGTANRTGERHTYLVMKDQRDELRKMYIQQGKMADPDAQYKLGEAPDLQAECMTMCPEFERYEREYQKGLDRFERVQTDDSADASAAQIVDHQRAVKRYRRSAAGDPPPLPCDVRPPVTLIKTLDYLFNEILDKHGLENSYSFVRDRARAIRNDLTLQNYRGPEAIEIHERIARYHILCSHALCGASNVSIQQEHEQLRKTLQSLIEFYQEMSVKGVSMPNEAEFQAYYILTHMWSNEIVSRSELELPRHVFLDPRVQLALHLRFLVARTNEEFVKDRPAVDGSLNDYIGFFRLFRSKRVSYLFACCMHMELIDIRRGALKAMQQAYYYIPEHARSGFRVFEIVDMLAFENVDEAIETLQHYDIPVVDASEAGTLDSSLSSTAPLSNLDDPRGEMIACIGKVRHRNAQGKTVMARLRFDETRRVSLQSRKSVRIIEAKRFGMSNVDIINGSVLPSMMSSSTAPVPFSMNGSLQSNRTLMQSSTGLTTQANPFATSSLASNLSNGGIIGRNNNTSVGSVSLRPTTTTISAKTSFSSVFTTPAASTSTEAPQTFGLYQNRDNVIPQPTPGLFGSAMSVTQAPFSTENLSTMPAFTFSGTAAPSQPAFGFQHSGPAVTSTPTFVQNSLQSTPSLPVPPLSRTNAPIPASSRLLEHLHHVQDAILADLIDPYIYSVATETLTQAQTVSAFIPSASMIVLDDAIQSIVRGIIHECLALDRIVNALGPAIELSAMCLFETVAEEIVVEVVNEVAMDLQYDRDCELFGWLRWRYVCMRAKTRRRLAAERLARSRALLAGGAIGPAFSSPAHVRRFDSVVASPDKVMSPVSATSTVPSSHVSASASVSASSLANRRIPSNLVVRSDSTGIEFDRLAVRVASTAETARAQWWRPIDINSWIAMPVLGNPAAQPLRTVDIKLVLATPCGDASARAHSSWLPVRWLRSKFEQHGSPKLDHGDDASVFGVVTLVDETFVSSSALRSDARSVHVLVQHDSESGTASLQTPQSVIQPLEQRHNSEARLSGATAVVFQIGTVKLGHGSSIVASVRAFWTYEALRLCALVSGLPARFPVPLIVVFSPSESLPADVFISEAPRELCIDQHVARGSLGTITFFNLDMRSMLFDDNRARATFQSTLQRVLTTCPLPPPLRTHVLQDPSASQLVRHLEHSAMLVEFALPSHVRTRPELILSATRVFTDMYNAFVDAVLNTVADPALVDVAFPSRERASVWCSGDAVETTLLWNAPATLERLRHMGQDARLQVTDKVSANMNVTTDEFENAIVFFEQFVADVADTRRHHGSTAPSPQDVVRLQQHIRQQALADAAATVTAASASRRSSYHHDQSTTRDVASFSLANTLLAIATFAFSSFAAHIDENTHVPFVSATLHRSLTQFVELTRNQFDAWRAQLNFSSVVAKPVSLSNTSMSIPPVLPQLESATGGSLQPQKPLSQHHHDTQQTPNTRKRVDPDTPRIANETDLAYLPIRKMPRHDDDGRDGNGNGNTGTIRHNESAKTAMMRSALSAAMASAQADLERSRQLIALLDQ